MMKNEKQGIAVEIQHSAFHISTFTFRLGLSVLSGALLAASFPALNWHGLVWVACLPLLAAVVKERGLMRAFFLGYICGVIFFAGSCYWLVEVMEDYGRLSPALSFGVLVLFVIVCAIFFGFFGLVEAWMARRSVARAIALSPFLWVSMEIARTYLLTGFPWNLLGYAVQAKGLMQVASVTAVYGLSFLAVATSALLLGTFHSPKKKALRISLLAWLIVLLAANFVFQPPVLPPGGSLAVLVQPNVPLDEASLEKWAPWRDRAPLERLVSLSLTSLKPLAEASSAPALVIWAENPAPFYFYRDTIFRSAMENLAREGRASVVVNTVTFAGEGAPRARNSAVVLNPDGREVLEYDKIHLVPFGEYVPWWAFPGKVGKITTEVGDFVPGSNYQVASTPGGKIGVFICYEAIFPQLVRRLTAEGAGALVNISDDGWYGDSSAAPQHLEMARLRAVENGRYLLRATNDGITVFIDPYGRVMSEIPRHRQMALTGRFDYRTRTTFYTRQGDVFAWACVAVTAGLMALRAIKAAIRN